MTTTIIATNLLDKRTLDNPYPFYDQLRQQAPVWRVPGTAIFIVSRLELIEEATRRVEDFSSNLTSVLYRGRRGLPSRLKHGSWVGQFLATADPPTHAQHKAAVSASFKPKQIAAMHREVETVADAYLDRALQKARVEGAVDFMTDIGNPVPMKVVSDLVGFPNEDIDRLLQAAFDSTAIVGASLSFWELARCILRSASIQLWLNRQIQLAAVSGENIMASIKRSIGDRRLSRAAARGILHTFLAAGGESTTSLMGSAVRILAEDAALQDRLRSDPEQIPNFIEEVLRYESPFRFHLRSVPKPTSLGGIDIPAGATVLLFWAAGNRDPEVFPQPERFDLDRPRRHISFGRGIHTCIGAPLARLEARVVISKLLERTDRIALVPENPPRWVESLQVRRYHSLPVMLTPRS